MVSLSSVSFLDLRVGKIERWNSNSLIGYCPYFKPSNRTIPLSNRSAHHFSVHQWPRGQLDRLAGLSSTHSAFCEAKRTLLCRYARFGLSSDQISTLQDYDPFLERSCQISVVRGLGLHTERIKRVSVGRPLTLVLEYHPAFTLCDLRGVLDAAIRKYQYCFKSLIGGFIHPRVAWRNGGVSLFSFSRRWRRRLVTSLPIRE